TIALSSGQFQLTRGMSVQQIVQYSGLANLEINTLGGLDTVNVASTASNTATTIDSGSSLDQFGAIDLTTIGAAGLTIAAGGNGESLTLNTTTAGFVTLSNQQVERAGNGAVKYSGFANLIINGSTGADAIQVLSTAAGTSYSIDGQAGDDLIIVGAG